MDNLISYCKHKKFSGYFINFEEGFSDIEVLKRWLEIFTFRLKILNPENLVVWYDSLNEFTGNVQYQN